MRFIMEVEKYLPKHYALEWNCEKDYPFDELYPTVEMQKKAAEQAKRVLKNK